MLRRLCARLLRGVRVDVPFADVICPEHLKSISLAADWSAEVVVDQALVFLRVPHPGELQDTFPADPDADSEPFVYDSLDAKEIAQARRGDAIVSYWEPRAAVTPYALYRHQLRWRPAGSYRQPAIHSEVDCRMRTGLLTIRISTPASFEAAVVFRRPRWRRLDSEPRLVRYALSQLATGADRPALTDNRRTAEWTIANPRIGERYICVAFHQDGVAQWHERLKRTSVVHRFTRWLRPAAAAGR